MSPEAPEGPSTRPDRPADHDADGSGSDADHSAASRADPARWPIRAATADDWPELWREVLQPVFAAGETYSFAPDIGPDAARAAWLEQPDAAFVATDPASGAVLGSYYIKPNRPGLGAHICNCGYAVAPAARGGGIASALCQHSQAQARQRGYRGMQFNSVVATNTGAIRLWQRHGYSIVGTVPGAYHHSGLGYVDSHIMFKSLVGAEEGARAELVREGHSG